MKNLILFFLLHILFLSGCSSENYIIFEGESNNWEGKLQLVNDETDVTGKYSFRLTNCKIDEVDNLTININDGQTILKQDQASTKKAIETTTQCSGCATFDEGSTIPVTISWNNKE
ncbi:hypothetical protein MUO14_15435 [Halobacillus shinanisalinarum]|uniref:Lipoprotein n=1 Tax=Halobacillus shinanisalinarum TaxID=2932258 RepID=A0ABY4GV49_9BACI|nr:hypothetical protein [Halobacillus shinanisalinarum]UOQ91899.1 hypothetical protein MUO14_15435 [Halobacillus shinanisalinarum]